MGGVGDDLDEPREYQTAGLNCSVHTHYRTYLPLYEKYNVWLLNSYLDGPNTDRERDVESREDAFERALENGALRRTDVTKQTR